MVFKDLSNKYLNKPDRVLLTRYVKIVSANLGLTSEAKETKPASKNKQAHVLH